MRGGRVAVLLLLPVLLLGLEEDESLPVMHPGGDCATI